MAEVRLIARNALPQGEALSLAGTRIEVLPMRQMTSLMSGRDGVVGKALRKHHGLDLPEAGCTCRSGEVECLWFGRDLYLLIGAVPSPLLAGAATMTDQSDGWASVLIEGPLARDVLARMTPLDLRDSVFLEGATARSEVAHMMASLTRTGRQAFRIMVFRSMAENLLAELREVLESVAARAAL